jgi:hypothetical protein
MMSSVPDVINGSLIPELESELDKMNEQLAIAMAMDAPQSIIDGLNEGIANVEGQLEDAGAIMGAAVETGIVKGIEPISDSMLDQMGDILSNTEQGGSQIIDSVIAGIEKGRISLDDAISILPESMRSELEGMEEQLHVDLVEALLNNEDISEIESRIDMVRDLMEGLGEPIPDVNLDDLIDSKVGGLPFVDLMDKKTGEMTRVAMGAEESVSDLLDTLFRSHGDRFVPDLSQIEADLGIDWTAQGINAPTQVATPIGPREDGSRNRTQEQTIRLEDENQFTIQIGETTLAEIMQPIIREFLRDEREREF